MKKEKLPVQDKTGRPGRFIVTGIFAVVIAAGLVAGALHFEGVKNSYKREIAGIQETYGPLSQKAALTEETRKKRTDFYKRRFYLDFPLQSSYAAANFIRKITLVAPGEIQFSEIEIRPAAQTFVFLLSGYIKTDNTIKAQTILFKFRQALSRFDDVLGMESAASEPGPAEKQGGLYFTIRGEIVPE
jgi:hypothetical protein